MVALVVVVRGLALLLLLLLPLPPGDEEGGDGGGTEADWSRDLMGKSWVSQVSEHVSEWAGMLPGSGSSPVGNPFAGLLDRPVANPFAGMQVPSMPDPFAAVGVRNPFAAAPVAERGTAPAAAPSSSK